MKFTKTPLSGVFLIEPDVHQDGRGFFAETYRRNAFCEHGIEEEFVQDNHSQSSLGALRGLHYQIDPCAQSKLIRVLSGAVYDVAVDIRKGSPTFGKWYGELLSGENKKMLYVPTGFAHGFLVTQENTHVLYKVSQYYPPEHERGILWNDPTLNIAWPDVGVEYTVSAKDQKLPQLEKAQL